MFKFLTQKNSPKGEWRKVRDIIVGEYIAVPRDGVLEAHANGAIDSREWMGGDDILWDEIVSIEEDGVEQVWDIEVEDTHNFVGNNIFAHNTASALFAGNVGIGTTAPNYPLETAAGANNNYISVTTSGTTHDSGIQLTNLNGDTSNGTSNRQTWYLRNEGTLSGQFAISQYYPASSINIDRLTILNNGNVGIGTTNPGFKFQTVANISNWAMQVTNSAATNAVAYFEHGGGYGMHLRNDSASASTYLMQVFNGSLALPNAFFIQGDGNIGIGNGAPTTKLDITSADNTASTNMALFAANNRTEAVGIGYQDIRQTAATAPLDINAGTTGAVVLGNVSTGGTNIGSAGGNTILNQSSGSVSIGTVTPRSTLDITNGTANIPGDTSNVLNITGANQVTNNANVSINTNDAQGVDIGGSIGFGGLYRGAARDNADFATIAGRKTNSTDANYSGYLAFSTRNSGHNMAEAMRIDNMGNVGIGTTALVAALNVEPNVASVLAPVLYLEQGQSTGYGYSFNIDNQVTGNLYLDRMNNTNSDVGNLVTLTTTGNLGIGTTLPQTILSVHAATNENLNVVGHLTNSSGIVLNAANDAYNANVPMELRSSAFDFTGGNVGIGSATPAARLDILGPTSGPQFNVQDGNGYGIYVSAEDTLNFNRGHNADDTGYINYNGYNDSTTHFRDLSIDNGKNAVIAYFQGSSGNVGIGTTNPAGLFTVHDGTNRNLRIKTDSGCENTTGMCIQSYNDAINANMPLSIAGSSIALMEGNVGIGTTTPTALLAVNAPGGIPSFAIGSSTGSQFMVDKNGMVGIGGANTTSNKLLTIGFSSTGEHDGGTPGMRIADHNLSPLIELRADASSNTVVIGTGSYGNSETGFVGTASNQAFNIISAGSDRMTFLTNGNVGIGTTNPLAQLAVGTTGNSGNAGNALLYAASDSTNDQIVNSFAGSNAGAGSFVVSKSRGTHASPSDVVNADATAVFSDTAYSGGTYFSGSSMVMRVDGTFTSGQAPPSSIQFKTNLANALAAVQMTVKSDGKVGIGTGGPDQLLSVNGAADNTTGVWGVFSDERLKNINGTFSDGLATLLQFNPITFTYNGQNGITDTQTQQIGIVAQDVQHFAPYMINSVQGTLDGQSTSLLQFNSQALPYITVNAIKQINGVLNISQAIGTSTPALTVDSNLNIAIGTSTPMSKFSVFSNVSGGGVATFTDQNATCTIDPSNASLTCSSDENLKKNVTALDATSTLANFMQLQPVTYNWNGESAGHTTHTGLIAQQVQTLFPEFVSTDTAGHEAVAYTNFVPVMISVIQQLNTKVTNIDTRLTHLESLMATEQATATAQQNTSTTTQILSAVSGWLADAGNGLGNLFANNIHAKQQLCVGNTCVTESQFLAMVNAAGISTSTPPTGDNGIATSTPGVDTSAPVITMLGNNPAQIVVGSTYSDFGATVSDTNADGSVNNNLGLHFSVDGTNVDTVTVDTSTSTTHTIIYSAVDGAGNWGYATRTIDVIPM